MNILNVNLWTALITPFNEKNQVDFATFEKLLKAQKDAGNGLLILGSTGEGTNLPTNLKKEIIHFVHQLNLNIPTMISIGGTDLDEQLKWLAFLEKHSSIHCYLVVTPIYAKPGKKGQYYWFKKILDNSSKPCMLYNIPGRAGVKLNLEACIQLADHPHFYAIKEAGGDLLEFKNYKQSLHNIKIYSGDDGLMFDHARLGASGLVSVASNVWPKETNLYVKKCLDNTLKEKQLWMDCSNSLFIASNPVPVKRLMHHKQIIPCPYLFPPLHWEDLEKMDSVLKADYEINKWYQLYNKE